jgi:hypothetical protein
MADGETPLLSPPPYFQADMRIVDISFKDDVTVILHLGVSFTYKTIRTKLERGSR